MNGSNSTCLKALALVFGFSLVVACDRDPKSSETGSELSGEQAAVVASGEQADDAAAQFAPQAQHIASTPRPATIAKEAPLDVAQLLPSADAQKLIGRGAVTTEPLLGKPASPNYNAMMFRATNAPASYGVGLQVWKLEDASSAEARLGELKGQYLSVLKVAPAGATIKSPSFLAERAGIRSYLFVSEKSPHVVGLSCASDVCKSWSALVTLGSEIESRL
ncbi:MAG: hypothetical protein H0U74_21245 [Bradymonadaceae bacterium]|nr:hypothetical protein [Lujinxingiaceae bacterium]